MTDTPTRIEAELAVIGCMLLCERAIDCLTSRGGVVEWFTDSTCNRAAEAILTRYADNRLASDMLAIMQATDIPAEWFDDTLGKAFTEAHAPYYCDILKGYAEIDGITKVVNGMVSLVRNASPEDAHQIKAQIESSLNSALGGGGNQSGDLRAIAHEWLDRMTSDDANVLLDWPVQRITDAVGKIDRELIWLVAQPSCGKTAFCLQWCSELARLGITTSMASLESPLESIASRLIAQTVPMDTYPIRQRQAQKNAIARARAGADAISEHMRMVSGSMTIDQLYAWGRAEKRKGSRLLIIDNTRHIKVPGFANRIDEMAQMSVRLKQLRDDTDLPVVICHHSNKDNDVSWSSDVRRDADMLIFLREDEERTVQPMTHGDVGQWCISYDVEKNREGLKDVQVLMRFKKEHQRFELWQ